MRSDRTVEQCVPRSVQGPSRQMLRNKNLIPLSHQHQHALALCVRIERAAPIPAADLEGWQAEIELIVRSEIVIHFVAEEQVVFPAAARFEGLAALVKELIAEHALLRRDFADAELRKMSAEQLAGFAQKLSAHIRKEERLLFERLQKVMSAEELAAMGTRVQDALKDASPVCSLPAGGTNFGPAQ